MWSQGPLTPRLSVRAPVGTGLPAACCMLLYPGPLPPVPYRLSLGASCFTSHSQVDTGSAQNPNPLGEGFRTPSLAPSCPPWCHCY